MQKKSIEITQLTIKPCDLFKNQWLLLTCGDYANGEYNTMTIGWGAVGTIWNKPFVFVAVRHSRFTYEFMEKYDTFTVSAFPAEYHKALSLLGSHSGRDSDKISASGLTPEASILVAAPSFKESELSIECQKMYWNDLNPVHFLDQVIYDQYKKRDYHRIYYGEILQTSAVEKFIA